MGSVLVLNAQAKHALVAIRCLKAEGLRVTAGSTTRWNAGMASRDVDERLLYPDPEVDPAGFVRAVERELKGGDYDVLLPINERTVETVVEHRDRFEPHAAVPFLPLDDLQVGLDKRRTVEAARRFDVPHPETRFSDDSDVDEVVEALDYPIVVKPTRGSSSAGVSVCDTREDLERAARRTQRRHGPVVYQEHVPNGGERGVYTLYDGSGTLAGLTVQRRIRSYPPSGGPSTYRETVADPSLVALTDEFLSALGWRGLAMAEYRIDARSGEPRLLEINPRLWGSLALSTFAGVNFPYLLYQMATGEDPEPALEYDVGVQARCLFTDVLQALAREDNVRALAELFEPARKPCRYDILSVRDPMPTLGQFAYWATTALARDADEGVDVERDDQPPQPDRPTVL